MVSVHASCGCGGGLDEVECQGFNSWRDAVVMGMVMTVQWNKDRFNIMPNYEPLLAYKAFIKEVADEDGDWDEGAHDAFFTRHDTLLADVLNEHEHYNDMPGYVPVWWKEVAMSADEVAKALAKLD